ncbi:MAG: GNAT family N-acetyltransferase [Gemmataceae bacterium]|nr:GNAT family N-acetyltransferase [Gemmataceae bacterium]
MSPVFRRAHRTEAAAVADLVNLAYRVEDFFKIGDRTDRADIEEHMARGVFLVADGANGLAGSVFVEVEGARGYFGLLSVHPAAQGRGLGRTLVAAAEAFAAARGSTVMELSVIDLRRELPAWYKSLGYKDTGQRDPFPPHLTRIPCQFIHMARPLAVPGRLIEEALS